MILLAAAWMAAFVGIATIAMTNRACSRAVAGREPSPVVRRRGTTAGTALLLLCLALAILRDGPGLGLLLGPLLMTAATAGVIVTLTVRPRYLHLFARMLDR